MTRLLPCVGAMLVRLAGWSAFFVALLLVASYAAMGAYAAPALTMRDAVTLPVGQSADIPIIGRGLPTAMMGLDLSLSFASEAVAVQQLVLAPAIDRCMSMQAITVDGGVRIAIACPSGIGAIPSAGAPLFTLTVRALKRGKSLVTIRDCQIDEQPLDCHAATVIRTP